MRVGGEVGELLGAVIGGAGGQIRFLIPGKDVAGAIHQRDFAHAVGKDHEPSLYIAEDLASLIPLGARQATQNFSSSHPAVHILIRNIDRSLSQEQITDLFRKHGKVTSCTLVMDPKTGQSKGFGFAEMPNMDESSKAISQLNGLKVGSSALRVKRAANSTITKHRGRP